MADNSVFIPWGLHPIKPWVIEELQKRGKEYGYPAVTNENDSRSGVRAPWLRFFSNGISPDTPNREDGFLMYGVHGFNDSFGFGSKNPSKIGFGATGEPHTISETDNPSFTRRPPPSVESVDVELAGGQSAPFSGLCRKAVVKWRCYSLAQLNYLTPYFLSPKVTCCVEWGWDNYNPGSLIDYSNVDKMRELFGNSTAIMEKIKLSNGNYDAHMGYVIDYSFTMNGNGIYDCSTTIVNVAWLFEGQDYGNQTLKKRGVDRNGKETWTKVESFKEFNTYCQWDNLESKAPPGFPKHKGRIFKFPNRKGPSGIRQWIRMDYFIEIVNHFFTKNFEGVYVDAEKGAQQFTWNNINIDKTMVSSHPGIKSVDVNVLIPSKYAPKYISEKHKSKITSSGRLSGASIENAAYYQRFGKMPAVLKKYGFTDDYDDLYSLLNKTGEPAETGKSFPVFSESDIDDPAFKANVGYVGYLKDLYISTDMIKKAVANNNTVKALFGDILSKISSALSATVELRMVPDTQNTSHITFMDVKFSPIYKEDSVRLLPRIIPGDVNNAYLLEAGMQIKMSQEMANQVLFTSGRGELRGREAGSIPTSDSANYGRFVANDRLRLSPVIKQEAESVNDSKSPKLELSRTTKDTGFNICQMETVNNGSKVSVDYYLNEPNKELMSQIVMEDPDPKAVYINNVIMPGSTFEFETLGIGGFTYLGQFVLDHVPRNYSYENAVWQISGIKQMITGGTWKIKVTAQVRPISTTRG